jgi:hypothetical protein
MAEGTSAKQTLAALREEHRKLDEIIESSEEPLDQIESQRLKKRKLRLKDEIARLESKLLPDIIA